jgi:spheroidene monooxygenase
VIDGSTQPQAESADQPPEASADQAPDGHARHRSVTFSFFRYRARWAPLAFTLMGFQRLVRDGNMPAGDVRLLGCGGQEGFSIVPDFNRYCLYYALDDPDEESRLKETRLWRLVAGPSTEALHFRLRPASGHGSWDGVEPYEYSGHKVGERPFVVLTHARVRRSKAPSFWRSVPQVRAQIRQASGCPYHIGFGEHPLLTLATFSVWTDLPAMRAFAYGGSAHHATNRAARAEQWLTESLFARFEIERMSGDLAAYPSLDALAATGRIPT